MGINTGAGAVGGGRGGPESRGNRGGGSRSGSTGGGGGTGQVGGMNVGNATTADYGTAASYGLNPGQYQSAVTGLRNKIEDARDMNEHGLSGVANSVGKHLLGFGGYYEADPSLNQANAQRAWGNAVGDAKRGIGRPVDASADRMIDPFQVGANLLGAVIPGVGLAYGAGTTAFGHPSLGQIAMDHVAPPANQIGGAPGFGSVSPSTQNGPPSGSQGGAPGFGNTGNGGNMGAFGHAAQAPGGAAFGPQPNAPVQQAQNPMGAFFSPQQANHSLPQGYNSMFPNSLSPQDMALLYGKTLA